jgi:hypothetical protein
MIIYITYFVARQNRGKRYTAMSWRRVYMMYTDYVKLRDQNALKKNEFLSLRKKHRPLYCKHRTVRSKRRWNHLVCTQCSSLRLQIRKEKDLEKKKSLENMLEEHYANQVCKHYLIYIYIYLSLYTVTVA